MIFIDSTVPMYVVGAEHPNKGTARRMLESAVARKEHLVTDAEVFQEILHRYAAIRRLEAVGPAFDALSSAVHDVFPVDLADVQRARRLISGSGRLSARDALHAAIMQRYDVAEIMTFDRGFDGLPGIRRLSD